MSGMYRLCLACTVTCRIKFALHAVAQGLCALVREIRTLSFGTTMQSPLNTTLFFAGSRTGFRVACCCLMSVVGMFCCEESSYNQLQSNASVGTAVYIQLRACTKNVSLRTKRSVEHVWSSNVIRHWPSVPADDSRDDHLYLGAVPQLCAPCTVPQRCSSNLSEGQQGAGYWLAGAAPLLPTHQCTTHWSRSIKALNASSAACHISNYAQHLHGINATFWHSAASTP